MHCATSSMDGNFDSSVRLSTKSRARCGLVTVGVDSLAVVVLQLDWEKVEV